VFVLVTRGPLRQESDCGGRENRDVHNPVVWSMGPDYLRFEALVRGSNDLKRVGPCVVRKKSVFLFLQRGGWELEGSTT
jgi:hypothetical protein